MTTIYYFTGTGNSLWAARKLSELLDGATLKPMAKLMKEKTVAADSDTVGFVFPLYFSGTPDIVMRFVDKINLDKADYCFTVVTRGLTGGIVFSQLNGILERKSKRLHSAFYLTTHDNYIPNFNAPSEEKAKRITDSALSRIQKIADIIRNKVDEKPRDSLAGKLTGNFAYHGWIKEVHEKDREFWTDERCNSCGTCVKVCPVDNVEMVDGKPSWHHRCEQCFACIHLCPKTSIQIGRRTLKRTRYRHPDISLKDIIAQKG